MERHGIGTDASIPTHINNITVRHYVTLGAGRILVPTELGALNWVYGVYFFSVYNIGVIRDYDVVFRIKSTIFQLNFLAHTLFLGLNTLIYNTTYIKNQYFTTYKRTNFPQPSL
jgi:hypothetical protein